MNKSKRMNEMGMVSIMDGENTNAYMLLVEKKPLGRPIHRWGG
jgi:hypothetical protein